MNAKLRGLYAITPDGLPDTPLFEQVEQALLGGAAIVQYRDKSAQRNRRLRQARELARLCRHHEALFIINDDIQLAQDCHADGVHLGQQDATLQQARKQLGENAIIGISCYNQWPLAATAAAQGADYVAFGACFASRTKPQAAPASLELLRRARRHLSIPTVAIGGINPENARLALDAGAHMLALIQGLFAQNDIRSASAAIARMFNTNRGHP